MEISPEPILNTATGFMAAKQLFVANEIGIFEALAKGPLTLDNLALKTRATSHGVRIVADSLVAMGLLTRGPNGYENTPPVTTYLTGAPGNDLRPFLKSLDTISYPAWNAYTSVVKNGKANVIGINTEATTRIVNEGFNAFSTSAAIALAATVKIPADALVLDVGAGSGTFIKAILGAHPRAKGTLYDLPAVAHVARAEIQGPVASRIDVVGGDVFKGDFPKNHNVVVMANFIHMWNAEKNLKVLERARAAIEPGAQLMLVDFWTNASRTEPTMAVLLAGEFLTATGEGDVYSVEDAKIWLDKTGFRFVAHTPLAGAQSVIIAEAI